MLKDKYDPALGSVW